MKIDPTIKAFLLAIARTEIDSAESWNLLFPVIRERILAGDTDQHIANSIFEATEIMASDDSETPPREVIVGPLLPIIENIRAILTTRK